GARGLESLGADATDERLTVPCPGQAADVLSSHRLGVHHAEGGTQVMPSATTAELSLHWPALGVCRVPYQVFTDPVLYTCEQERIFRGDVWHWVGLEVGAAAPGDFRTRRLGDT